MLSFSQKTTNVLQQTIILIDLSYYFNPLHIYNHSLPMFKNISNNRYNKNKYFCEECYQWFNQSPTNNLFILFMRI